MKRIAPSARGLCWRVETLEEVGSTNDLVAARAREGAAEGLVIRARSQTRGRGRRGRAWFSPPGGGLYFSALLRPDVRTELLPATTLLMGVAVAEGLQEATGCRIGLKWPNDLRVEGKKIGGILCECAAAPDGPPAVIAGVGINVATGRGDFPPALREAASSVLLSGGRVPRPEDLLHSLLGRVAFWYKEFLSNGFGEIRSRWLSRCDHLGQRVSLRLADRTVHGRSEGIDEAGRLMLQAADGAVQRLDSGAMELL